MNHKLTLVFSVFAALFAFSAPARADIDVEVAGLIGTGIDSGDANNNPYALQLGAVGELSIGNLVLGVRGTRSKASDFDENCTDNCRNVKDLKTIGGDIGYAWNIAMLHVGPRLGLGYIKERNGDHVGGYMEPGAVAEANIMLFVVGADLRYRIAFGEDAKDLHGFLAYLRLGVRF